VSGCSDHIVRVFSVAEERWLPEADLKVYDEHVANQALPSQQIGDVKKSDLPGLEALDTPGEWIEALRTLTFVTDGGNRPEAWRNKDGQERGCCRSTPGKATDQSIHGVNSRWNTVGCLFEPVDQGWNRRRCRWVREETTVPRQGVGLRVRCGRAGWCSTVETPIQRLRCAANVRSARRFPLNFILENPWTAAQRFLQANELPLSYLDEVVKFIEKNAAGVSLGGGGQYNDPYTGTNSLCTCYETFLTFFVLLKAHHDTNPVLQIRPRRTLVEPIHSLERLGTSRHFHHPVPLKVDSRTRSRGLTDTSRHPLPGSPPHHPARFHQPQPRAISSPMYV
jgi:phospholipase A-2-activating protein